MLIRKFPKLFLLRGILGPVVGDVGIVVVQKNGVVRIKSSKVKSNA